MTITSYPHPVDNLFVTSAEFVTEANRCCIDNRQRKFDPRIFAGLLRQGVIVRVGIARLLYPVGASMLRSARASPERDL
jgi:hypothetical protein